MVLGYALLGADVAEHVQLLLVFSAHAFFLSGCAVETREFRGTASASNRVFPQPVRAPYPTVGCYRESMPAVLNLQPPDLRRLAFRLFSTSGYSKHGPS